ncbi:MAG: hypothetical protein J5626_10035 [Lachnospiraceae bacterium]|nr:hypothetical protein [Lachnospiraceae bacterium]
MDIKDLRCPCCGGKLDDIEEGRINFFCSYCGSALCVVYEDSETDNIIRMKVVEARLNDSKAGLARESAELAKESAHAIEAETEQMRLENMIKESRRSKFAGMAMVFFGALILGCEVITSFLLFRDYSFSIGTMMSRLGKPVVTTGICILFVGLMVSVALVIIGVRKVDELTDAEIDYIEEKIDRLYDALDVQQRLFDEQKAIAHSVRFSILGKKARMKKAAKRRAREIKEEMSYIESQIKEYESAL